MTSNNIVVEAPTSFTGSAKRIWRWSSNALVQWLILLPIVLMAWLGVAGWYIVFGIWLIPYRLIRRSQRNGKVSDARHAETIEALRRASGQL